MATIAHSVLTGSELHEPKGVAAAAQNSIYVANATTGGAWLLPVPVGILLPFGGTAAPALWLLSFGQDVSRTTYALLFTAISTTYGVGDGSTTFGLPDLRGRVVAGQDDMGQLRGYRQEQHITVP